MDGWTVGSQAITSMHPSLFKDGHNKTGSHDDDYVLPVCAPSLFNGNMKLNMTMTMRVIYVPGDCP